MTLDEYIVNPQGKNNSVLNATAREAIRSSYIEKFDAILMREKGSFSYTLYNDAKKNRLYAHFKVPSETIEGFYYDVVFEFFADQNISNTTNLFKYNINFYSNDPAFVYTYAYVFSHHNLFIKDLKPKMSKKALIGEAKDKNPGNQVGYVKTFYFAYLFMKHRGLNDINKFKAESMMYSVQSLLNNVEDADTKVGARENAGEKLRKIKSAEKKKEKQSSERKVNNPTPTFTRISKTGNVKTVSSVKTVKSVKRK